MKRKIFLLVGLLLLGMQVFAATFSFKFDGNGFISDGADIISARDKEKIDFYLDYVKAQTSYSILVVTLDTLEGVPASRVASVVSEHGAGADRDNILVFLVAPTEGKIGVEIGENLKSDISYISLKNIIQDEVSPAFKNGDYSKAITDGIYSISRIIEPSLIFLDPEQDKIVPASAPVKETISIEKKYLQGGIVGFFGLIWFIWRLFANRGVVRRRRGGFGNHFSL